MVVSITLFTYLLYRLFVVLVWVLFAALFLWIVVSPVKHMFAMVGRLVPRR